MTKTLIPEDKQIVSCQCIFNLHSAIDHHGQLLSSDQYTASIVSCTEVYYCNDDRVTHFDKDNIQKDIYRMDGTILSCVYICPHHTPMNCSILPLADAHNIK